MSAWVSFSAGEHEPRPEGCGPFYRGNPVHVRCLPASYRMDRSAATGYSATSLLDR